VTLIQIDANLCAQEGACIASCPWSLITCGEDHYPVAVAGALEACIRCGQCVAVCLPGALTNTLLERDGFQEMAELNKAADPLAYTMRTRRSVRAFQPEPVSKADLKSLLDVVRYAPSSNNSQNLWWIVTTGRAQTQPLAVLAQEWMQRTYRPGVPEDQWPREDLVLRGAPHLLLCCGPEDSKPAALDAAIAVTHVDLLAAARGLGACWAGVFMRALAAWPPLQEALGLPPGQKAFCGLLLGRPKHAFRLVPPRKPSAVDWR